MAVACQALTAPVRASLRSTTAPRKGASAVGWASAVSRPSARGLRSAGRRKRQAVKASKVEATVNTSVDPFVQNVEEMGFDLSGGVFGFTPFAELWVGRMAMLGFAIGFGTELITHVPILQQVGINTPSPLILYTLSGLATAATGYATFNTLFKVATGKMTQAEKGRYQNFLRLNKEAEMIAEDREQQVTRGWGSDFTGPDDFTAIKQARQSGNPADRFLSGDSVSAINAAAEEAKAGDMGMLSFDPTATVDAAADQLKQPLAMQEYLDGERDEEMVWLAEGMEEYEVDFARSVEIDNGRWAMLGFLAAILIESATGQGVTGQLVSWGHIFGITLW